MRLPCCLCVYVSLYPRCVCVFYAVHIVSKENEGLVLPRTSCFSIDIQSDPGGTVNNLGGSSIGHSKQKM
jgi:hypothetical protein